MLAGELQWSDVLKALADSTRWDICRRLASEELCVCHLVEDLGLSQSLVSHHLRVLREAGLLEQRRHSYWTYYRLRKEAFVTLADELERLADSPSEPARRRSCT